MKNKKITIVDYEVGNILSIKNAITYLGEKATLTRNDEELNKSTHIILPGVGAFPSAMNKLKKYNLHKIIQKAADRKIFILGICLGMQLLFQKSTEIQISKGLNLIEGEVDLLSKNCKSNFLKLPHIGWNYIIENKKNNNPILDTITKKDFFYFVHSYGLLKSNNKLTTSYSKYEEILFPSVVQYKNIFGCQFHPEKSANSGLKILKNFISL